ncbi:MAG: hypothetical protein HYX63_05820 [Gammaproteobacteria bacterium]|nr:hypothetical protein [Gammaproteobacteria bacterium]
MPDTPFKVLWMPRGKRAWWRRPWFVIPVLLITVLALALSVVLRPAKQREFLLQKLAPYVTTLGIEYVRITPWSATLRGVDVTYRGGKFHVGKLDLGFNPWSLLNHTVAVDRVYVRHTELDLRQFEPPPKPEPIPPFPGVLASLNSGYGVVLDGVDVALAALLRGDQNLTVRLHGGGIKPHIAGEIGVEATLAPSTGGDHIDAVGKLTLSQLARGRFRAVRLDLDTRVALSALLAPERARISASIEPPSGLQGNEYRRRQIKRADGTLEVIPNPDAVMLTLQFDDESAVSRATFELNGLYRGEDGVFSAGYRLRANERAVRPYVGPTPIPLFKSDTSGAFQIDTRSLAGLVTLESALQVTALDRVLGTNPALPATLLTQVRAQGTFDAAKFALDNLALATMDADKNPRLQVKLAKLTLAFAAPRDLLTTPKALAEVVVGPLPLAWFNGLASDLQLAGDFTGNYVINVDDKARLKFEAVTPSTIHGISVKRGEKSWMENLAVKFTPSASWSSDFTRFALNDFTVATGDKPSDKPWAALTVKAAQKHGGEARAMWRYRTQAKVDFDAVRELPVVAEQLAGYPVPAGLTLTWKGLIAHLYPNLSLEKLDLAVAAPGRPDLLHAVAKQAFHFELSGGPPAFNNPTGDLGTLAIRNLDLAWFNPILGDIQLAGHLSTVDWILSAPSKKVLAARATSPLKLDDLSVTRGGKPLLRGLRVAITPSAVYGPEQLAVEFSGLALTSGGQTLVSGQGKGAVAGFGTPSASTTASGKLALNANALARQPVVAAALPRAMPSVPVTGTLEFDLTQAKDTISARVAHAVLALGERATIEMTAEPGLVLRGRLAAGENLARHIVGAIALNIKELSSSTLAEFVSLKDISLAEINSSLRLNSDGNVLRATSLAPLGIADVRITDGKRALFDPFSLASVATVVVADQTVHVTFNNLGVTFAGHPSRSALLGKIDATFDPSKDMPLTSLASEFTADLPQLLNQTALMPGHKLTGGELSLRVAVDPTRKIDAKLVLDKLSADAPLAISTFEMPVTGEVAADGNGFDFTAPLTGRGKSGISNATVVGHYAPQPDEPRVLRLEIASELFYLNDILAAASAISPRHGEPTAASAGTSNEKPTASLNEKADDKAAWKVIPYAMVIDLKIAKLFYTDYLAFTDVAGKLDLRRHKLALSGIKARFHDSSIEFDGTTRFKDKQADPYDLNLTGKMHDFDLNQFFTELVPGEKPRIEGLFSVDIKAFGRFPNFFEARNRVLFDIKMTSREGVFRPLPPDSGLMIGASDILGVVGEGLSYVPTGGFGAGAIARLVNYIAEINYDSVDIHLVRDASKDVKVEQFLVLSPTIAMSAAGGIDYQEGHDILDSPLSLQANLDMLGRGAAILYSMDLMQDQQNALGYWKGPEFKIWGTPAAPQSNFERIVQDAGDQTLSGAIIRPISGLIGNLKFRWFGNDAPSKEAAARARAKKAPPEPASKQ